MPLASQNRSFGTRLLPNRPLRKVVSANGVRTPQSSEAIIREGCATVRRGGKRGLVMNASDEAAGRPSQRLEAWIREQLRVHQSACRMPADRELAERFGMSVRTVQGRDDWDANTVPLPPMNMPSGAASEGPSFRRCTIRPTLVPIGRQYLTNNRRYSDAFMSPVCTTYTPVPRLERPVRRRPLIA